MARRKFRVAFSTIGANTFPRFLKLIFSYSVSPKYWWRIFVSGIVSLVAEPFRWYQHLVYQKRLKNIPLPESPLFILGHWRSGTTLMHNLVCQDKRFAYITTYQGVFVNVFFSGRWLFRNLMKALMPEKRAIDNVKLAANLPQEEGFALANLGSFAFYNYWYFPNNWQEFYQTYIACHHMSEQTKSRMLTRYKVLIAQSLLFHNRTGFVSKNPPNSGRIKLMLEMFPNAKFIYLYRHPMKVYQSTLDFFSETIPALQLQTISDDALREMVFGFYENLIRDYEAQKSLIPKGQLIEIRYEDFIANPMSTLGQIYTELEMPGFEKAKSDFQVFLEKQKKFVKNKREFSESEKATLSHRLGFAMKLYGYET